MPSPGDACYENSGGYPDKQSHTCSVACMKRHPASTHGLLVYKIEVGGSWEKSKAALFPFVGRRARERKAVALERSIQGSRPRRFGLHGCALFGRSAAFPEPSPLGDFCHVKTSALTPSGFVSPSPWCLFRVRAAASSGNILCSCIA